MTSARPRGSSAVVERPAVLRGAAVAVAVCLPLALVSRAIADGGEGSPWLGPLLFGVLAGFFAGGAVAARAARAAPMANGGLAALLAFAVIQGTALVARLATEGDVPSLPAIVFDGLLAYCSGLAGSVLATRRQRDGGGGVSAHGSCGPAAGPERET